MAEKQDLRHPVLPRTCVDGALCTAGGFGTAVPVLAVMCSEPVRITTAVVRGGGGFTKPCKRARVPRGNYCKEGVLTRAGLGTLSTHSVGCALVTNNSGRPSPMLRNLQSGCWMIPLGAYCGETGPTYPVACPQGPHSFRCGGDWGACGTSRAHGLISTLTHAARLDLTN